MNQAWYSIILIQHSWKISNFSNSIQFSSRNWENYNWFSVDLSDCPRTTRLNVERRVTVTTKLNMNYVLSLRYAGRICTTMWVLHVVCASALLCRVTRPDCGAVACGQTNWRGWLCVFANAFETTDQPTANVCTSYMTGADDDNAPRRAQTIAGMCGNQLRLPVARHTVGRPPSVR